VIVMNGSHERWIDEAAGPLVRPYAMTRGRTRPQGAPLDLVTIVFRSARPLPELRLSPEQHRLLAICRRPHAIADLAAELDLPLGVVGVLVGDLIDHALLEVAPPAPAARLDDRLLRRVIDDLHAL
jgi:uncharacterized protein DUF742